MDIPLQLVIFLDQISDNNKKRFKNCLWSNLSRLIKHIELSFIRNFFQTDLREILSSLLQMRFTSWQKHVIIIFKFKYMIPQYDTGYNETNIVCDGCTLIRLLCAMHPNQIIDYIFSM